MIYCNNCNRYFDEEQVKYETNKVPYGLGYASESKQAICPRCNSTDLDLDVSRLECEIRQGEAEENESL